MRGSLPRILMMVMVTAAQIACSGKGQDESEADTGDESSDWFLGSYYQPPFESVSTTTKYTLTVRADRTAVLETELCGSGVIDSNVVAWEEDGEGTIRFTGAAGEQLAWFLSTPFEEVSMRRTDDPELVEIRDGDNTEGPTLGDFRRGNGCLIVKDSTKGCGEGSFVVKCPSS